MAFRTEPAQGFPTPDSPVSPGSYLVPGQGPHVGTDAAGGPGQGPARGVALSRLFRGQSYTRSSRAFEDEDVPFSKTKASSVRSEHNAKPKSLGHARKPSDVGGPWARPFQSCDLKLGQGQHERLGPGPPASRAEAGLTAARTGLSQEEGLKGTGQVRPADGPREERVGSTALRGHPGDGLTPRRRKHVSPRTARCWPRPWAPGSGLGQAGARPPHPDVTWPPGPGSERSTQRAPGHTDDRSPWCHVAPQHAPRDGQASSDMCSDMFPVPLTLSLY